MDVTKFFNIEGEPPTAKELEKLCKRYTKRGQIINWLLKGCIVLVVLGALIALLSGNVPMAITLGIAVLFIFFVRFKLESVILVFIAGVLAVILAIAGDKAYDSKRIFLGIASSTIILYCVGVFLEERYKALENLFKPVSSELVISDIIRRCEANSVIATYQNKLAAQGRLITSGEYKAMENYGFTSYEKRQEAEMSVKEKIAQEKLLKPIVYKGEK